MKKYLLTLVLFLAPLGLRAEEPKPAENLAPVSEEALRFVLDKAKQYTAAGENAIAKAVDVAQAEAPELIREYLTWKAWELGLKTFGGLGFILLSVFGLGFGFWSFGKRHRWVNDGRDDITCFAGVLLLPFAVGIVPACFGFFGHLGDFVKVTLAPRVFLVEQLVQMMK